MTAKCYSFNFQFHSKNVDDMEILVGTNKLSSSDGTHYKVKKVIKHEFFYLPEHLEPEVTYDIALVWVQNPIEFNEKVQPIKYSTEEVGANENLQIIGWGYYKWNGVYIFHIFHEISFSFIISNFLWKLYF